MERPKHSKPMPDSPQPVVNTWVMGGAQVVNYDPRYSGRAMEFLAQFRNSFSVRENAMSVPREQLSLAAFLEWENAQETRNEFHRGEVFAMVGARRAHGLVVSNLARHLGNALDGSPCQLFQEGMKLAVTDDTILCPDIFVTCDEADLRTDMIFRSPTLAIEVLFPTTEAYERSHKFALYRRLASLKEYVLVNPESKRVEAFVRGADGLFVLHDMSENVAVLFRSLGVSVAPVAIFDGLPDTPLDDRDQQHVGAVGDPDLRLHGVFAGAENGLKAGDCRSTKLRFPPWTVQDYMEGNNRILLPLCRCCRRSETS